MAECELRRRVLGLGFGCDEDTCVFWEHFGPDDVEPQCAIQYFQLLGDSGSAVAEWLLGLKERTEIAAALGLERHGSAPKKP
jgi:hypothetical protein